MNVGFWSCFSTAIVCAALGCLFWFLKGRSVKFISGFHTFPKEKQDLYDKEKIASDMKESLFLWAAILGIGAVGAYFVSSYIAIIAFAVWLAVFFREVHLDANKQFEKYLMK